METKLTAWTMPDSYFGATWEGWYVAPVAHHRDSDTFTESNWAEQLAVLEPLATDLEDLNLTTLGGDPVEGKSVLVIRENHWAVGWVEWLGIHKSNETAIRAAEDIQKRLEDYPSLNDERLSEMEMEAANQIWRDCYDSRERIQYMREHWSQFEPRDWEDLMGCARGKWFLGYESDLIYR